VIKNDLITLKVKQCNSYVITFGMRRDAATQLECEFDFDFRYYTPYHDSDLRQGGLYVFKTADKDSTSYAHTLKSVVVYGGKKASWFLLTYKNRVGPPT
jgi:hypothetical protein